MVDSLLFITVGIIEVVIISLGIILILEKGGKNGGTK